MGDGAALAWAIPPARPIILPAAAIHIWRARLSDASARSLLQTDLPDAEQHSPKPLPSRLCRAFLRNILSRYTQTKAARLPLGRAANGKPYLSGTDEGPFFNVAHTGDIALIALANQPVGIDVERADRSVSRVERLLSRMAASEADAVRRAADPQRALLRLWTRKEAFMKCTGDGIRRGLSSFDVDICRDSEWISSIDGNEEAAREFWAAHVEEASHVAAVVYHGRGPTVVTRFDWRLE